MFKGSLNEVKIINEREEFFSVKMSNYQDISRAWLAATFLSSFFIIYIILWRVLVEATKCSSKSPLKKNEFIYFYL